MKQTFFLIVIILFVFSSCTNTSDLPLIKGEIEKVAGDFIFSEGPAADNHGNVYFTDIPNNRIHIWTIGGQLEIFLGNSGGANGLYFDENENLIACEGVNKRITLISKTKNIKVLANEYQGKKFNKPNDLWITPDGGIYFSDPAYGVDSSLLEMGIEGVYFIHPDGFTITRVCEDLIRPNGIIGTKDGKKLYITDHYGDTTWEYSIQTDGSLAGKKIFADMGCDGLAMDSRGNVYLTNVKEHAIDIYSPSGEEILSIPLPERPTNICFGGANQSTLFITAPSSLYKLEMNIKGQYAD